MEVRQARYFLAIADHQSMGRAAEMIHITQPALSQALVQMERELKTTLFQRTSRGMRLTDSGAALVEPARRLVEASRIADSAVQIDMEDVTGHLTIATTPAFASAPLAGWVAYFRTRYPDVAVHMVPYAGDEPLEKAIERHSVDLVLAHYERELPEHVTEIPIGREEMVLVVPAKDDPFEEGPVHLHQLEGHPLLLSPENTSMHTAVTDAFQRAGIEPTIGVETRFMDSFIPLTAGGAGWSILTRQHIEITGGGSDIHIHPLTPAPFRSFSFYFRSQGMPLTVRLFLGIVKTLQRV